VSADIEVPPVAIVTVTLAITGVGVVTDSPTSTLAAIATVESKYFRIFIFSSSCHRRGAESKSFIEIYSQAIVKTMLR
jgi:hypothetical protein